MVHVPCVDHVCIRKRWPAVYCIISKEDTIKCRPSFAKTNMTYARHTPDHRVRVRNRDRVWVRVRVRVRGRVGAWPFLLSFPKQPNFCGRPLLAISEI
jgi:hypothetical protein